MLLSPCIPCIPDTTIIFGHILGELVSSVELFNMYGVKFNQILQEQPAYHKYRFHYEQAYISVNTSKTVKAEWTIYIKVLDLLVPHSIMEKRYGTSLFTK